VVKYDEMLKLSGRLKGDHVTHLWSWIERPIAQSSIYKCSYANDIIKGGPMMWLSFTMDGNR
jgi:ABC-type transporter Mla MlaB component